MKKIRIITPKILLSGSVAIISPLAFLGGVLGYVTAKFLAGKQEGQRGRIKSITFNIRNWRLHLHHWLICLVILIFAALYNFFPLAPHFSFGFLGGWIFQGISCYSDWHRILIKNKKE